MRRIWMMERHLLDGRIPDDVTGNEALDQILAAFMDPNAAGAFNLIHRYEKRLHRIYQRALKNLFLLQNAPVPNGPNPISEQSQPAGGAVITRPPASEPAPPAIRDAPQIPDDQPTRPSVDSSLPVLSCGAVSPSPVPETGPTPLFIFSDHPDCQRRR